MQAARILKTCNLRSEPGVNSAGPVGSVLMTLLAGSLVSVSEIDDPDWRLICVVGFVHRDYVETTGERGMVFTEREAEAYQTIRSAVDG